MIRQKIFIVTPSVPRWEVHCYYAVTTYHAKEIARQLAELGCDGLHLFKAVRNMESGELNHGLCYSDTSAGRSVMVIGLTSSAAQFLNSLTHELHHLVEHICQGRDIDTGSEAAAYLAGDLAGEIYPKVAELLCPHCRRKAGTQPSV